MRAKYVHIAVASARNVAERWRAQYERPEGWMDTAGGNSKAIYDKLCALGDLPSLEEVAEIINNQSWSFLSCDGCNDYIKRGVRLGDEYSEGKIYCATCILEAHEILNGENQ